MKTNDGKLKLLMDACIVRIDYYELRMTEEYLYGGDISEVKTENSSFERREKMGKSIV